MYIYLDPPNPRNMCVFGVWPKSTDFTQKHLDSRSSILDFDCIILDLVRQRTKNICSASNDQGENPQNPTNKKKTQKSRKKPANPEISLIYVALVIFGSF